MSLRICQIGSHNLYTPYLVNGLSDEFSSIAIMLKHPEQNITNYYNSNVDLIQINKKQLKDLLNLIRIIKKIEVKVDCFLFHYLNPYFAFILALGIISKPVAYFCYSGDIQKFGLIKELLKIAFKNVNLVISESQTDKRYLVEEYNFPDKKICTIIWYPVDEVFKRTSSVKKDKIREQWGISKDIVIFSPRALNPMYNHHALLEGIAKLGCKEKTQAIFSGFGVDIKYQKTLKKFAADNNIDTIFLSKVMTPKEMAELYTISLINVNIPQHDGMGRSIIEGALCGSVPLLNKNINVYTEFFKDKENCIFVEPTSIGIAEGIKYVLDNPEIKENFYKNNIKMADLHFNWNKSLEIICGDIKKIIEEVKI